MKIKVSPILTAGWKGLRKGRNGRYRSGRFRDALMAQLNITSVQSFYNIINGKQLIEEKEAKVASDLMQNIKQIR